MGMETSEWLEQANSTKFAFYSIGSEELLKSLERGMIQWSLLRDHSALWGAKS